MKARVNENILFNERQRAIVVTIKQMLVAIRKSENFGEDRLMRVLQEWVELDKTTYADEDTLFLIDDVISKILGKDILKVIGKEKL